ncbi:MAG: helix-turn-helix domain-containing protein [Christensenellales bacterium]
MKVFADRFRELRQETGLAQDKLALELKIGKSTVSYYETERSEPTISVLNKIADYFDVSTDYLLGRTDFRKY